MPDNKLLILAAIILAVVIIILILLVYHIFATSPSTHLDSTHLDSTHLDSTHLDSTHPTKLTINHIPDVTAGTNIAISGELIDLTTGLGIEGQQITFTGNGVTSTTPPVTMTQGITLENPSGLEVVSCEPATCTTTSGQSHVVKVTNGLAISFPPGSNGVTLLLSGTQNNFVVQVTQYDDTVFTQSGYSLPPDVAAFSIVTNANASIKKIEFMQIDGPSGLLLSEIRTLNTLNQPQNISQVNFDQVPLSATSPTHNPLSIYNGTFSSSETTDTTPSTNTLEITAHFGGNSMFASSDSDTQTYQTSIDSTSGVGGMESSTPDSGKGFTRLLCSSGDIDTDRDGLCDQWETPGVGVPYVVGSNTFHYPIDANVNQKNIFVQVDSMSNAWPTDATGIQTAANAITDVKNVFGSHAITFNAQVAHTNLPPRTLLNVWTDSDTNTTNDFDSLKATWFGTDNVRPQLDASGLLNGCTTCTGTHPTFTVTRLQFSTPNNSVGDNANGAVSGTITIKQTISFGIAVSVSTPITNPTFSIAPTTSITHTSPIVGPQNVIITWGAITAAVTPGTSSTQTVTLTVPFVTNGPILSTDNANIGTISYGLTISPSTTVNAVNTGANSPTITDTLMNAYAQVWRYALWANCISSSCNTSPSGIAEQGGAQGGNDLIVALSNNAAFNTDEGSEAGTFMHELGHTLGLKHGGPNKILSPPSYPSDSGINCKPNYISIMNYPRQMASYLPGISFSWVLDYSSGNFSNSPLIENRLDEPHGLIVNTGVTNTPTIIYGNPSGTPKIVTGSSAISQGPPYQGIDWNVDTHFTTGVISDIDNLGIPGCTTQTENIQLNDYDDWSNLFYNFTNTGTFDGVEGDPKFVSEVTPEIFNAFNTNANVTDHHGLYMPIGP